jgi:hypothetical protein
MKQAERSQTLFATPVQTPEKMAAQVRQQLERAYTGGPPPGVDLALVARRAVDQLWESRVKIFVPVLALRAARDMVRNSQPSASA